MSFRPFVVGENISAKNAHKVFDHILFSAHISYMEKENIQIKRVSFFFYKISQAPNLYLTLRVLPIELNSHNFSFVRYVLVKNSGLF